MIDLTSGLRVCILLSAGVGAAAQRPPVEAPRPKEPSAAALPAGATEYVAAILPIEAPKPSAAVAKADPDGQNSGGPGTSAREQGIPAPAAEPDAREKATAKRSRPIWVTKPDAPKPAVPPVAGGPKPVVPAAPTRVMDPLDRQVDQAIDVTGRRVLSVDVHTPWQIGHGMLAFRRDYMVRKGNQKLNAFEWVATNPTFRSRTADEDGNVKARDLNWFYLTPYGARPQKFTGTAYEFEGHPNQFLAFFALSRLPLDFEFTVQGRTVTLGQMLHNAKMEVTDREEVAWDLWAFSYYFDMNEQWTNAKGEAWSMERLVSTTLRQFSHEKSPCGGCHALFALASARNAYLQAQNPMSGVWTQAHMHLEEHIELARRQQNRDGSFSSSYFNRADFNLIGNKDPSKRISTTGHTLEFLMMALKQDRLKEPWVRNAVNRLSRDLIQYQTEPLEVGGMYHAVHSLVLYRERTRLQFADKANGVTPASGEVAVDEDFVTPVAAEQVEGQPAIGPTEPTSLETPAGAAD